MRTVHCSAPRVVIQFVGSLPVSDVGDARLQRQQVGNVSSFHGKLFHLALVEGIAQRRIRSVDNRALGGNFHHFRRRSYRQLHVDRYRRVDE